jgi:hypothetical protein
MGKRCKLAFQPAWRISGLTSVPFPFLHSPVWRHGEGGKVEKIVRGSRGFFYLGITHSFSGCYQCKVILNVYSGLFHPTPPFQDLGVAELLGYYMLYIGSMYMIVFVTISGRGGGYESLIHLPHTLCLLISGLGVKEIPVLLI